MQYEFIDHTADIQFKAYGATLEEVFSNSALATVQSMCDASVEKKTQKKVEVKGHDYESLLYNFLEELIVLLDVEHFLLSSVSEIKIDGYTLSATLLGDASEKYEIHLDVKAITYNSMFVKLDRDLWIAQVVLDV